MTYCVGILVREGLVMIGDTRTNAGVDNIATFRKLHLFETPGERAIGFASAGNLSVAQSVLSMVTEGFQRSEFLLKKGMVDRVVHRHQLRSEIARLIDYSGV